MKVYIVQRNDGYDDGVIIDVFAQRKDAEDTITSFGSTDYYYITEEEVIE